jgi:putative oxidoreductase
MRYGFIFRILSIIYSVIFMYAGIQKLIHPLQFADGIASFQILPLYLISFLAVTLPPLEIFSGCLLFLPFCRHTEITQSFQKIAYFSVLILCSVFLLAVGSALVRGIKIDCGCFGSNSTKLNVWWIFLRDCLLFMGAVFLYAGSFRKNIRPAKIISNV